MSCILNIETSTNVCSVALSQDGVCLYEDVNMEGPSHAQVLAGYVKDAVSFADSHAIPIDAIAISKGPGSYTGLRIGVSEAKGVAYGRDAKLLSVPTLKLLTVPILLGHEELPEDALLCPMIDARRMEVYCALYDRALNEVVQTQALVIDSDSFKDYLDKQPIYFMGNGADKCVETIQHPNAHFIKNIVPRAKNMIPLAEMAMAKEQFEDVAYFEPFYLKEFVATKSKKLL
ncbi:tRNA (adenosine(37)-N6)-threonylcarbamoyltransferase complex dimerization subunit type 1 TsaB [Prevotellamassilia timonensis]|uniref:tRNA (adenosine(37)-N6)-threonylcarbamoyltransferase complex dimerization subunit type 1 TsaB n=1 Tax=Prevotellamassilia timonensis TaxID=1852370 RepID=UPI00402669AB